VQTESESDVNDCMYKVQMHRKNCFAEMLFEFKEDIFFILMTPFQYVMHCDMVQL